jgi:hypothetical protein
MRRFDDHSPALPRENCASRGDGLPGDVGRYVPGDVAGDRDRSVADDLRMRAGEGVGAGLATGLLVQGLALRRTAQVDY